MIKKYIIILLILGFQACVEDVPYDFGGNEKNTIVLINEIHPSASPDWIELYNPSKDTINLYGYTLEDDQETYEIDSSIVFLPFSFMVFWCDDQNNGMHTNFKLSSSGEHVSIYKPDGSLSDEITFPKLDAGKSYGRFPDGDSSLIVFDLPTPGKSNQ